MRRRLLTLFGIAFFAGTLVAQAVDVTIYNQDLGLVRETRKFNLKNGVGEISVVDVPSRIDATSVHFKSLTAPESVSVIEQNFQYDLISQEKLLEKYLGKEIELERFTGTRGEKREAIHGTLLSSSNGRVLQVGKKIYLNPPGNPVLSELPEGFLTRPTLLWTVSSKKAGEHNCEISYMTSGMGWSADYVVVSGAKDDKMDLNAWVTINNNSGAAYKDAKLKLVAGDVNRIEPQNNMRMAGKAIRYASEDAAAPQFAEKNFFEYHLYTLQRPTTLRNNENKQIEMASASDVPMKKLFIYDGAQNIYWQDMNEYTRADASYGTQGQKKVWVVLEFKNSKDNNLGFPLPKGRVRVYKKDTDGGLEFIGEDSIDHTPKDELVRVKMGNAFDVVGERTRTNFVSAARSFQETFEIKLRNHKDEDATVRVVEHLYRWTNWKVTESSQKFTKKDAQTIEFEVPVKKDGESVVTYTVKYSW